MPFYKISQIGKVIRDAAALDDKNEDEVRRRADSLVETVQELFALLEERRIEYVLVGGIALLHYVEGRNTQDIDLLMAVTELEKLPEFVILDQDQDFVRAAYKGLQIDVLLTRNPLFAKAARNYVKIQHFMDRDIPLASVEGLILLKLYALPSLYRQGNFARVGLYENDIATLLHDYPIDTAPLLAVLAQEIGPSDLAEIQTILSELQRKVKKFKRRGE